jgi:hypothetical protein
VTLRYATWMQVVEGDFTSVICLDAVEEVAEAVAQCDALRSQGFRAWTRVMEVKA